MFFRVFNNNSHVRMRTTLKAIFNPVRFPFDIVVCLFLAQTNIKISCLIILFFVFVVGTACWKRFRLGPSISTSGECKWYSSAPLSDSVELLATER